jgi:glycosyltransferase involved in cell wall biosynthesis
LWLEKLFQCCKLVRHNKIAVGFQQSLALRNISLMGSFSVIVPVLNKENEIIRSLQSIEDSIDFFYRHYDRDAVSAEVIVVNEGSNDRTLELVTKFAEAKPHYKIINHFKSLGIGPARNTGAKISQGEILFFCDGDDLVFQEHFYLCFQVLTAQPNDPNDALTVVSDRGTFTWQQPQEPVGVVRTQVHMKDQLHPHWKRAVENTIMQNLGIRRECHEFVEGFPESPVYKQIGCEDISYDLWITKFFKHFFVELETVEYIRYPGNNLDRQLKKFQTPPELYVDDTPSEKKVLHGVRHKLEQEKLAYLLDKFTRFEQTAKFRSRLNWQQLASEYLTQQKYDQVIQLCEQGVADTPTAIDAVRNLLAVAYNNHASALHQQKNLDQAKFFFKKAVDINPALSNPDLARLHYNVSTVLRDQENFDHAYNYLRKALELDPQLPQAIAEFPKIKYQAQVAIKGYQFTQDWFSNNVPIWETELHRFVNVPDLRVLEIGSWEGRSTCWLIDNLLTHPSARITCIDTFEGGVENKVAFETGYLQTIEERFDFNMTQTGCPEKVRKMVGKSQEILRSLIPNSFHLVYIDGSHVASDVLEDTLLTWGLVKLGGVLVFDDYGFNFAPEITENPPRVAIDAFINTFSSKIKLLHQGYQVILEKTA